MRYTIPIGDELEADLVALPDLRDLLRAGQGGHDHRKPLQGGYRAMGNRQDAFVGVALAHRACGACCLRRLLLCHRWMVHGRMPQIRAALAALDGENAVIG